jgi:hypothetical protein
MWSRINGGWQLANREVSTAPPAQAGGAVYVAAQDIS